MERTRVAVLAALSVVVSVAGAVFAAGIDAGPGALGAVSWPVSTLLVSEVQTGGASASDEFAEITNVGASAVDLAGLELAYATSTGTTMTRKASWSTSLLLEPGRHLFVANTSGVYASLADATYSGGFAATGGAIVLRVIGGATIDAVGWGDATNAFVEGSPIAAPAAGSSIERKPGGLSGNTLDSNSNSVDWFGQSSPNPQSLAAPPVPAPVPTAWPTPPATVSPTATASPTPSESPTLAPTLSPTVEPTVTVTPTPTVEPTSDATGDPSPTPTSDPGPTATPTPTLEPSPTLEATPEPTTAPTPTLTPAPTATPFPIVSIAAAREVANDSTATVVGILTTPLGALESGRKAFIQDDTAGIALYLDAAVVDVLPAGTIVQATGTLDDRFAERTLRVRASDVVRMSAGTLPTPVLAATGSIGESLEGTRVLVTGTTVGSPSDLSDGLGLMVDDGSGQVRVIVGAEALGGLTLPSGTTISAVGPIGQRDSSGTGLSGYRIHVTELGDFAILPTPTSSPAPTGTPVASASPSPLPSPTPVPSSAPLPTPTALPTASPSASPSPSATATPGPTPPPVLDIVEARGAGAGTVVTVAGVVTAEAGRLGIPPVIAIADGTGGIAVRLPDGVAAPSRGTTVVVKGQLADPYGQLELRPALSGFTVTGHGSLPNALRLNASQLGESTEGRLAELIGTVTATPRKSTSGDLAIDLVDGAGTAFRVVADASSGITAADLVKDHAYRLTGIVGQRASRKGALDGYRLYVRDTADLVPVAAAGGPGSSPSVTVVPISTALAVPDGTVVTIDATVTASAALLDSSGRRIVVQDRSAAIEVLLPTGAAPPTVGTRLRVTGTTGLAWGAPRIAASELSELGGGSVTPLPLHRAPAERDEWLLVRLSGTVAKVNRIGERWRAEVTLADGGSALVQGQAGAGVPSTAIVVGRQITVTGIVRRPYPTASDRRFAVLPRTMADIAISSAGGGGSAGGGAGGGNGGNAGGSGPGRSLATAAITPDTDLATLTDAVGRRVKVGGLVARIAVDGFDLDDGTAIARVLLRGEMLQLLPHVREGEAIAATGTVELIDGVAVVVVDANGALLRVGTLGQGLPIGEGVAPMASESSAPAARTADFAGGLGGPAPVSLLALAALAALSVLATLVRRRLVQRRLRFALVARLASLPRRGAGPGPAGAGPGPAGASVTGARAEHESA